MRRPRLYEPKSLAELRQTVARGANVPTTWLNQMLIEGVTWAKLEDFRQKKHTRQFSAWRTIRPHIEWCADHGWIFNIPKEKIADFTDSGNRSARIVVVGVRGERPPSQSSSPPAVPHQTEEQPTGTPTASKSHTPATAEDIRQGTVATDTNPLRLQTPASPQEPENKVLKPANSQSTTTAPTDHPIARDCLTDIQTGRDSYRDLPATERESIVQARIGQGRFRTALLEKWGCCSVTGIRTMDILRASHIKPWRASTNRERLDVFNGLLLTPGLDGLFDAGYITFNDAGRMYIAEQLKGETWTYLGVNSNMGLRRVYAETCPYLEYHRKHVYRGDRKTIR